MKYLLPHRLTSTCLVGALVILGFTAISANNSALAEPRAPSIEELARLITSMEDSTAANPGVGELQRPAKARDASAPATMLSEVIAALDALSDDRRVHPNDQHKVILAKDAARAAFDMYGSTTPNRVIGKLRVAARHLMSVAPSRRNPNHDAVRRLSGALTMIAHRIAGAIVQRAKNAGAKHLRSAQTAMIVGEKLQARGIFYAAIGRFGGAANFAANTITFDIDQFEQNIRNALDGQTVGYAYSIGKDGVLYSQDGVGDARTATDSPQTDQSPLKEMYVASMSKTLSAVALLKALDSQGISVDAPIAGYLPTDWTQGTGIGTITFRHLLTHISGLDAAGVSAGSLSGQTLSALEGIIAAGSTGLLDFEDAVYTNANFSLMRILIPRVLWGNAVIANYTNVLPEDYVYAALYAQYVINEVLKPAGINPIGCAPGQNSSIRTLYYSQAAALDPGVDWGDWTLACGATGWYLSANALASFLAHLRYTDDIIDNGIRHFMNTGYLGWLNPVTFSSYVEGDWGVYRAHGGDIGSGSNPGMTGCMMNYPIHVEASLMINSRGGSIGGHPCTVLKNAYDNAWTSS